MEQPKLERGPHHRINAHQADRLRLWSFDGERENQSLQDHGGNDVFTVFNLTHDQLADLYLDIAMVLGKSPEPTLHHLKQIHKKEDTLASLLGHYAIGSLFSRSIPLDPVAHL